MCPSVTCHLRAGVGGGTRVLGVGSKAALAADRTSSGVGLVFGSPRAPAYLFLPPGRLRLFSHHREAMRDDEGCAALHERADGLLHEVLRLGVQGRRGLVQQQGLGKWGVRGQQRPSTKWPSPPPQRHVSTSGLEERVLERADSRYSRTLWQSSRRMPARLP